MLPATATTLGAAPVVVAQRLRKGSCGAPRGAQRLVTDALRAVRTVSGAKPLDSAFYGRGLVLAVVRAGADVSVTVRLDPQVKATIATISQEAWEPIEYPDAVFDQTTGWWISRAEVAEIDFTAFSGQKKVRAAVAYRESAASRTDRRATAGQWEDPMGQQRLSEGSPVNVIAS